MIRYVCEQCGVSQTADTGVKPEGMCQRCGWPMRIDDLFSDRRIAALPVEQDRRQQAA